VKTGYRHPLPETEPKVKNGNLECPPGGGLVAIEKPETQPPETKKKKVNMEKRNYGTKRG